MISFQSVVMTMLVAATAKAAIVSPSSSTVTTPEASSSQIFHIAFPSSSPFSVITPVIGSSEPTGTLSTVASGVISTLSGATFSSFGSGGLTTIFPTSIFSSVPQVATSTAVFTFTYVPISTVTVTEYRCHKPSSVRSIRPTITASHGTTISEPIYTETPSGTVFSSSVTFSEVTPSAVSTFPEGSGSVVTSSVFAQPTTSFAS